jgi:hypothetical protein
VPGAIYLHVPVPYPPPSVQAATVLQSGLLQLADQRFDEVWERAAPRLREIGVPVLAFSKPRPIVVLRVGDAEEDRWHQRNVWVLPRYSLDEYSVPRHGPNIFDLPAAPRFGLDKDGFVDFFQVTSLPVAYLRDRQQRCDLAPTALDGLLTAFRRCLLG